MKKRRKSSRYHGRGRGTAGTGARKKSRGKGHKGGKGMSGSGKRGDQKKTFVNKFLHPYFGRKGKKRNRVRVKKLNVGDLEKNLSGLMKKGLVEEKSGKFIVDLKEHIILGSGDVSKKFEITALKFSASAKKKIEKAGGKAIQLKKESDKKD